MTLAASLALAIVTFCFARLFFGVNWVDEAVYAAIPYRFALGDRPFVDELNIIQTAGLLEYPLVRVYVALFSTEGLILALRVAYLLFVAGIGVVAYTLLRRVVRWPYLLGGGLAYMCIVPLSLPTLSYNTLSAGFLTYGVLLGLGHLLAGRGRWTLMASGCCLGLAGVAYLPLLAVGPVFAGGMWLAASGSRRVGEDTGARGTGPRAVLWYALGLAAVLALFGALVLFFGVRNFFETIAFTRLIGMASMPFGGGAMKLHWLAGDTVRLVTAWLPLTLPLVVGALLAGHRRPGLRDLLIAVLPATAVLLLLNAPLRDLLITLVPAAEGRLTDYGGVAGFAGKLVLVFAIYAWLVVCLQLAPSSSRRALFWWGLAPVTVAGVVTAYTSSLGLTNGAFGLAPVLLLGPVAASLSEDAALAEEQPAARWRRLVLPVGSAIVLGLVFQWWAVWNDASIRHLTTRVPAGPYAGMLTTADGAQLSSQLDRDLGELSAPSDTVAFYIDSSQTSPFSAGYLFTQMRPCVESVWTQDPGSTLTAPAAGQQERCLPTLIVRMWPSTAADSLTDELPGLRESDRYELVRTRPEYLVFRLTGRGSD